MEKRLDLRGDSSWNGGVRCFMCCGQKKSEIDWHFLKIHERVNHRKDSTDEFVQKWKKQKMKLMKQ